MKTISRIAPFLLAATAAMPAAALDANLVIPASAHAAGVGGSAWATDVQIHNAGLVTVDVHLSFVADGSVGGAGSPTVDVAVPAQATVALTDIVATKFGLTNAAGALAIELDDSALPKIAISSRTYNVDASGKSFGQTIGAQAPAQALVAGQTAVLFAPSDPAALRFNLGVFALADATVDWRLRGADGTVLMEKLGLDYSALESARTNDPVHALFGVEPAPSQVIEVAVKSGSIHLWGSRVDNLSHDGDFSLATPVRSNEAPVVAGLDTDHNGSADVVDANHDGRLDQTLIVGVGFPYEIRLIASDPEGETLTFTGKNLPTTAQLESATGTIVLWGGSALGQVSELQIEVSDGLAKSTVVIPIQSL